MVAVAPAPLATDGGRAEAAGAGPYHGHRRLRRNAARPALWLALPGVVAATWSELPLAWDGASKLLRTLHERQAYIPHDRRAGTIFKWPVVTVQGLVDDPGLLRLVYSATYALVPLVALWLSWLVVRRRAPLLFVWPALGILVATLPGQAFFDNEALIATQLAWPLLLALLVGLEPAWTRWAAPLLVGVLFFLHPLAGVVFLLGAAVVVAGCRLGRLPPARLLPVALALALLGGWRLAWRDDFEQRQSSLEVLRASYRGSVAGAPIAALAITLVVGVLLVLAGRGHRSGLPFTDRTVAVLLVLPALWLVPWAADADSWGKALQFRAWSLLASLPFALLAVVDHWWSRPTSVTEVGRARQWVAAGAGVLFSVVLAAQSVAWVGQVDEVEDRIDAAPGGCLALDEISEGNRAATRHWGTSSLAIVVQGRRPDTLLLADAAECDAYRAGATPGVVGSGRQLKPDGWVKLPRP